MLQHPNVGVPAARLDQVVAQLVSLQWKVGAAFVVRGPCNNSCFLREKVHYIRISRHWDVYLSFMLAGVMSSCVCRLLLLTKQRQTVALVALALRQGVQSE